jgi:hypothetical protein
MCSGATYAWCRAPRLRGAAAPRSGRDNAYDSETTKASAAASAVGTDGIEAPRCLVAWKKSAVLETRRGARATVTVERPAFATFLWPASWIATSSGPPRRGPAHTAWRSPRSGRNSRIPDGGGDLPRGHRVGVDDRPAETELDVLARRYSVLTRGTVATGCLLLGLVVVPGSRLGLAAWGMVALLAWIAGYTALLLRSSYAWLVACDVALVGLAALGQQWTVPAAAAADGTSWVLAVVTITVVALQWHTEAWAGAVAMVLLVAAYVAGAWLAVGVTEMHRLPLVFWAVWAGILSRLCERVLLSAGRRADALLVEREQHRRALAVSAARRADEREQQALLHDTAAATLLMVGLGTVPGPSSWLSDQADRDLLVVQGRVGPAVPSDLVDLLSAEMSRSPVVVRHAAAPRVALPARVAEAIAGSVREALQNVARHAGVDQATLSVTSDPLQVEIFDAGCGFDPERVPAHRRGVAESIVARMAAVGGRATVRSAPGQGTLVRLEWPGV